jgi:hypothetical protein
MKKQQSKQAFIQAHVLVYINGLRGGGVLNRPISAASAEQFSFLVV